MCDDQHRLAVIAPARREHDDDHQHQRRHGPAQLRGVGILQDQRAELRRDRPPRWRAARPRASRLPPHADREHDAGDEVGQQEGRRARSSARRPRSSAARRSAPSRSPRSRAPRRTAPRCRARAAKRGSASDGREGRGGGKIDHGNDRRKISRASAGCRDCLATGDALSAGAINGARWDRRFASSASIRASAAPAGA